MEVKLINIKEVLNKEILDNVFNGKLGYNGIFDEVLNVAFFSIESILECYGNMVVTMDEGFNVCFSEELKRVENLCCYL